MVSIQYLRAVAALAVVLYHALQWRSGGFDVGRAGVDIFFVISGFVLWRATSRRPVTPLTFLAARASRVIPLYWLATLAVAGSALVWPRFLPQVRPGWRHLLLSLAFLPHFDPRGLPFPTLPPGWSLNYEADFYILFAIALAFARRWRPWVLVGGLGAATLAGFLLADPAYILGANPLLLEFVAGVLIGVVDESQAQISPRWGVALSILGLATLAAIALSGVFVEIWRPLLWGAPAACIVGGAVVVERGGRVPRFPAAVRLGDASYALYLVHLPATALVAHAIGVNRAVVFIPAALTVSVAAALACHVWIEQPTIRWLRRRSVEQPPSTA